MMPRKSGVLNNLIQPILSAKCIEVFGVVTPVHRPLFTRDGSEFTQPRISDLSKCGYVAVRTAGPKLPIYVAMPAVGSGVDVKSKGLRTGNFLVNRTVQCLNGTNSSKGPDCLSDPN